MEGSATGSRLTKNRKPGVTVSAKRYIFNRDGWVCYYCGKTIVEYSSQLGPHLYLATVDHLIPQCKGGNHTPANLVAACHSCNSAKGKRSLEEYRESLRYESRSEGEAIRLLREAMRKVSSTPFDSHVFDLITYLDSRIPQLQFSGEAK